MTSFWFWHQNPFDRIPCHLYIDYSYLPLLFYFCSQHPVASIPFCHFHWSSFLFFPFLSLHYLPFLPHLLALYSQTHSTLLWVNLWYKHGSVRHVLTLLYGLISRKAHSQSSWMERLFCSQGTCICPCLVRLGRIRSCVLLCGLK